MWFWPGKVLKKWLFLMQTVAQIELSFQGLCRQIIHEQVRNKAFKCVQTLQYQGLISSECSHPCEALSMNVALQTMCNNAASHEHVQDTSIALSKEHQSGPPLVVKQIGHNDDGSAVSSPFVSEAPADTIAACFDSSHPSDPPVRSFAFFFMCRRSNARHMYSCLLYTSPSPRD